jgi:cytochrome bd-type quinol oxidase subunit 2
VLAAAIAGIKSKINAALAAALWGAVAGLAALVALAFLVAALFVWIEDKYSTLTACLVLAAIFAALALLAMLVSVLAKRRRRRASREQMEFLASGLMDTGIELGRTMKNVPPRYLLLGAIAAGWFFGRSMSRK